MKAAEVLDREAEASVKHALLADKMEKAIERLLLHFPTKKEKVSPELILLHAHTMKGSFYLAQALNALEHRCLLLECNDASRFYLQRLGEGLIAKGIRTQFAVSPIRHDLPVALLLPEYSVSFSIAEEKSPDAALTVNMARFIDKSILSKSRSDYRNAASARKKMVQNAEKALQKAARSHFALEALYAPEMDFEKLEGLINSMIKEILHRFS